MVIMKNFEVVSDKLHIVETCIGENYFQKWISKLHNYIVLTNKNFLLLNYFHYERIQYKIDTNSFNENNMHTRSQTNT